MLWQFFAPVAETAAKIAGAAGEQVARENPSFSIM
jgi:hypothetical protein